LPARSKRKKSFHEGALSQRFIIGTGASLEILGIKSNDRVGQKFPNYPGEKTNSAESAVAINTCFNVITMAQIRKIISISRHTSRDCLCLIISRQQQFRLITVSQHHVPIIYSSLSLSSA